MLSRAIRNSKGGKIGAKPNSNDQRGNPSRKVRTEIAIIRRKNPRVSVLLVALSRSIEGANLSIPPTGIVRAWDPEAARATVSPPAGKNGKRIRSGFKRLKLT